MCVHAKTYRIPRCGAGRQHDPDGSHQNQGRGRMAISEKPHRRPLISRFHWVLPLLYPQLLACRTTLTRPDEESNPVGLGGSPDEGLRNPKDAHVHETGADPTAIRQTIRTPHRRVGIWRGRHTLTRGRHQPTKTLKTPPPPDCLLLGNVYTDRKELRYLRKGITGDHQSPATLETAPRLDAAPLHTHHRPCQPHILEAPPKSKQTRRSMVRRIAGLLVRNQTCSGQNPHRSRFPLQTLCR